MKLLHTADLQLGARFSQFGDKADFLREARLKTLERLLELARDKAVDAFIVAGDLFDDNHVHNDLVVKVLGLFASFSTVPILILPGNHDPHTGPGCVWERECFQQASENVHVFREVESVPVAGGHLLASPLRQKLSPKDPSLELDKLAGQLGDDGVKIGITHGSFDIQGKRQDNDFPIDISAASRGGLNYLAIGHWHGWMAQDDGKIVMPGTPEPDDFSQTNSGYAALVELTNSGQLNVDQVTVATLDWRHIEFDFSDDARCRQELEQTLDELGKNPEKTVVRVTMTGRTDPMAVSVLREQLLDRTKGFAVVQMHDETSPVLTPAAIEDLKSRSPLLAQVFADLDRIEAMIAAGEHDADGLADQSDLTLSVLQEILDAAKIELGALTSEHLNQARQLVLQNLPEADQ